MSGLAGQGVVEGHDGQLRRGGEGAQVGLCPVFRCGASLARQRAKDTLHSGRLFRKAHPVIRKPTVIGLPRLRLIQDVRSHYGFGSEQAKQAQLRETTEEKPRIRTERVEPSGSYSVVDVPVVRQGDPDVDVREKI